MLPAKPKCIFIVTALAKPLLKIGTMAMKVMLFSFVQLGCVQIFRPFRGVKILRKNVAAKPKCTFIVTAVARPLLKIGTILRKAMLLHFI